MAQDGGESDGKGGLLSIRVKKLGIVDSKNNILKIYIKRVNCDKNIQNRTLREKLVTSEIGNDHEFSHRFNTILITGQLHKYIY